MNTKIPHKFCFVTVFLALFAKQAFAITLNPTEYNGNYYQVISFWDTGRMNWYNAEAYAQSLSFDGVNGTLASVPTSGVDNFLWDLGAQGTFLGGYQASPGQWEWINGDAYSYTDWAIGEPNNWRGAGENYMMYWWAPLGGGANPGWNDTTVDSGYTNANGGVTYTTWGFTVEFETQSSIGGNPISSLVPEPSVMQLLLIGAVFVAAAKKLGANR
ncbi:MAG: lectin-like protein [Methylomonas sp.]|jgi:hypothetical protein